MLFCAYVWGVFLSAQANKNGGMSAYVVVVGNEKGGSGKSTIAIHLAVALMKAGQRVATIDTDSRQKSFTHYVQNRLAWCKRNRLDLEIPTHCLVEQSKGIRADDNEIAEADGLLKKISALEHEHDFVVIDTPGSDTYLMRLVHSIADTLITPLNDSFLDFDVLGTLDPTNFAVTGKSHYAEMVCKVRTNVGWLMVKSPTGSWSAIGFQAWIRATRRPQSTQSA